MEFKTTFSQLIYRIEPKPGGGFIGSAKDPAAPAIEGATREEVQQKIQQRIGEVLGARFPDLSLPPLVGRSSIRAPPISCRLQRLQVFHQVTGAFSSSKSLALLANSMR
jgi:hypothetical protein